MYPHYSSFNHIHKIMMRHQYLKEWILYLSSIIQVYVPSILKKHEHLSLTIIKRSQTKLKIWKIRIVSVHKLFFTGISLPFPHSLQNIHIRFFQQWFQHGRQLFSWQPHSLHPLSQRSLLLQIHLHQQFWFMVKNIK